MATGQQIVLDMTFQMRRILSVCPQNSRSRGQRLTDKFERDVGHDAAKLSQLRMQSVDLN